MSVLWELKDQVFAIRLNRPTAHNALDEALIEALHEAFDRARASQARAVVLSGEGKSFCAGADLAAMKLQGEATFAENEKAALRLGELFEAIDSCPLPVVARVQGATVGGGVGLVAACDVTVAASSSVFSLAEVRLGLVPAVISPYVLRKVGPGHARDLVLTGRRFQAAEAHRLGLVHRVAEDGKLDAAVDEVVRDLKAAGPGAISRAKRLLREVGSMLDGPPQALANFTARQIAEARAGDEGRAGCSSFLEKRPPPWAQGGGK